LHLGHWFRIEIAFQRDKQDQQTHDENVKQPDGLGDLVQPQANNAMLRT
jgi:hypothetical protein